MLLPEGPQITAFEATVAWLDPMATAPCLGGYEIELRAIFKDGIGLGARGDRDYDRCWIGRLERGRAGGMITQKASLYQDMRDDGIELAARRLQDVDIRDAVFKLLIAVLGLRSYGEIGQAMTRQFVLLRASDPAAIIRGVNSASRF